MTFRAADGGSSLVAMVLRAFFSRPVYPSAPYLIAIIAPSEAEDMSAMEPSHIEELIFNTLSFLACLVAYLVAAIFVFTKAVPEKAPEPEPEPEPTPEPQPEPEKHGGMRCDACKKDDPDRGVFVNQGCKHIVCDRCITLMGPASTLRSLRLCPDQIYRAPIFASSCAVCSHKKGYLTPYKAPIVRSAPVIKTLSNPYKSASAMVEVVVGAKTSTCKTFPALEAILTGRSKTFTRRLQGNTNLARDRRLKLPDHDPKIFGYILEFMYTGTITDETIGNDLKPTIYDFFDIWALASFLEMDELCNYCPWRILLCYDSGKKLDFVELGHRYSAKDASYQMKKLIVDFRVWTHEGMQKYWAESWPPELYMETANELRKRVLAVPSISPLERVENYYIPAPASMPSRSV